MGIDDLPHPIPPARPTSGHPGDAQRRHRLAAAWQRVARDACELVAIYQQAQAPAVPAFMQPPSGRHGERVRLAVWLLSAYQPSRRVYTETIDGRVCGTTTTPEVPGIALAADGMLYQYRLVKHHPMLTIPLHQATPNSPPSHDTFAALAARALGHR